MNGELKVDEQLLFTPASDASKLVITSISSPEAGDDEPSTPLTQITGIYSKTQNPQIINGEVRFKAETTMKSLSVSGNLVDSKKTIAASNLLKFNGDQKFTETQSFTADAKIHITGDLTLEVRYNIIFPFSNNIIYLICVSC